MGEIQTSNQYQMLVEHVEVHAAGGNWTLLWEKVWQFPIELGNTDCIILILLRCLS